MNAATNFLYRQITHIGRGLTLAQGLQMRLSGEENIPDDGGAVLVCNHTGYMDFLFGAFIAYRKKRLVRFLAKASIFSTPGVGALLRAMGHVPVDRIDGKESLRKAVELAEAGELVGVFSEGTISRSFEIRSMKTGASRIAFEAGVPVVPQVMFGSQRLWTKGHKKNLGRTKTPVFITALEPYYPTGDPESDTAEIRRRMQEALEGTLGGLRGGVRPHARRRILGSCAQGWFRPDAGRCRSPRCGGGNGAAPSASPAR